MKELKDFFIEKYESGVLTKSDIEFIWSELKSVSKSSLCMCKIKTYSKEIIKKLGIKEVKVNDVVDMIKKNKNK